MAGTSEEEATPLLELPGLTSDSAKDERDSAEEYLGSGERREDRPPRPLTRLLLGVSRVALSSLGEGVALLPSAGVTLASPRASWLLCSCHEYRRSRLSWLQGKEEKVRLLK